MNQNSIIQLINQLFEIENKLKEQNQIAPFERNINRLQSIWDDNGYIIQNPTGQSYNESRTDCEASIAGSLGTNMVITKALKPIIYTKTNEQLQLIQKGIVIVEKK
jgi:hypothetical protein